MCKEALSHIKDADVKLFVKQIISYTKRSHSQYTPFFTDFYNRAWIETVFAIEEYYSFILVDHNIIF